MNDIAPIGHNQPPEELTEFDKLIVRKDELFKGINVFAKTNPVLNTQELIDEASNFQTQIITLSKDVEKQRKIEKKPYDDGVAAVQAKFKPLAEILEIGIDRVRTRVTDGHIAMNKIRDDARKAAEAEQQRLKDIADAAAREAERLATLADDGATLPAGADLMGTAEKAQEAAQAVKAQEKEVRSLKGNVKGGTGEVDGRKKTVALHTYYSANVTDQRVALLYFFGHRDTKVQVANFIQGLADAAVRKAGAAKDLENIPPGVEVLTRQQAQ